MDPAAPSVPEPPPPIEEGFRIQSVMACEGLLRMLNAAVDNWGDLDTAAIYLSVVTANTSAATRDPVAIAQFGTVPIPEKYLRPVSRRAIAAATGLSRETTRRKVARLVADGMLVEDRGGVRGPYNILDQGGNLPFARALLAEFDRTGERLRRSRRGGRDATAGQADDPA